MVQHVQIPAFTDPLSYTASASQAEFAISFPFWSADDILVYVDGDAQDPSDFVVAGAMIQDGDPVVGAYGSGTVTLNTACTGGETVIIDRLVETLRNTDFSATGPLPTNQVNSDLDKLTARHQDFLRELNRTLRVGVSNTALVASAQINKVFGTDAAGNATMYDVFGDAIVPDAASLEFVADVEDPATQTLAARLKQDIFLTDSVLGVADGSTTTDIAWANALAAASDQGKNLYVPGGASFYKYIDDITVPDGVHVYGSGHTKQVTANKNGFKFGGDRCSIDGLRIEGPGTQSSASASTVGNGVYIAGCANAKVTNCIIHGWQFTGVQERDSSFVDVSGNWFYANYYDWPGGGGPESDILFYSPVGGKGHIASRNFCLSNNSQGISYNTQGLDQDASIWGNICITMKDDLSGEVASADLRRRHGISAGYVGGGGRVAVFGNTCRNTLITGVYAASSADSTVAVQLGPNNICSANGYSSTTDASLTGGICANGFTKNISVNGNYIYDFKGAIAGITGSINLVGQTGFDASAEVLNNVLDTSTAHGLVIKGEPGIIKVSGNTFRGIAGNDINMYDGLTGGSGGLDVHNNTFRRANASYASIAVASQLLSSGKRTTVTNNHFYGFNKTTAAASNSAYYHEGAGKFTFAGNHVETYYYGMYDLKDFTGRKLNEYKVDFNHFYNLNTAVVLRGTDATALVPCEGNTFDTVATQFDAAGYYDCAVHARRMGSRLVINGRTSGTPANGEVTMSGTAASFGTFAVGDVIENTNPVAGGTTRWVCTTAGAPATPHVLQPDVLSGSATYDAASIADGAFLSTTVTVTGAALGDFAKASFGVSTAGLVVGADVTGTDTVTVTMFNKTGGAIDLASTTLRARVWKG